MTYIMMILKKFIYQKKHKELVVIVDLADNIIGFSFHLELVGDEAFCNRQN